MGEILVNVDDKVKEFWDKQAAEFGASDLATAPDHAYRDHEIRSIIPHITGEWVGDVGCGNGYSTFKFHEAHPDKHFMGLDYSEKMILSAAAEAIHRHSDIPFITADVRNLSKLGLSKFDAIISERCLINLLSWEEQKHAILEMKKCLAPGGSLILAENFVDGLNNLNGLRKLVGLHAITVRWHNRYLLKDEFIPFINEHFIIEYKDNIGNEYYIASRVLYAAWAKENGQEPQYEHPINYIAAKLPTLGAYDYSPNMLYVLRPK